MILNLYPTFSCKTPTQSFAKSSIFPQLFIKYSSVYYGLISEILIGYKPPILYLFRTYSNKAAQSNDSTYSAPIPTKKPQSNNLTYSAPIPTKKSQSNNHKEITQSLAFKSLYLNPIPGLSSTPDLDQNIQLYLEWTQCVQTLSTSLYSDI